MLLKIKWVFPIMWALSLLGTTSASYAAWHNADCQLITAHCSLNTQPLLVSPSGPYYTIEAALAEAKTGDTIEVQGGVYPALVVTQSVMLRGIDGPVIDGGGQGTVVQLSAPGIVFTGFTVQGSGVDPDRDHAGVTLTAPQISVLNNRLRDVLFGVFVSQADGAVVRDNDITSKAELSEGRRGDGVRLWYSREVLIENNVIHDARDVVVWYSDRVIVRHNRIERGRYAIHLMYCNGAVVEDNQILDNSVGIYTMYSKDVVLRANLVRGQRGPSGYALGFKDAENIRVADNALIDNRTALFLDGTPFSPAGYGHFENNLVAFNDVGVTFMPAVRGNTLTGNTFWENVAHMSLAGGGTALNNTWHGNYWSDYAGYDADGDGVGDTPYRAERFFEDLTDREPLLRALLYSPATQALEFAATTFPVVKPQPKLVDDAPLFRPPAPPASTAPVATTGHLLEAAALLLGVGFTLSALPFIPRKRPMSASILSPASVVAPMLQVAQLTKRYGAFTVLDNVTFEVQPGEAIALWGANGAGKSTLIKAFLGLITFEGRLRVADYDTQTEGKAARRSVGYVPQEMAFYDLTTRETVEFYARLKGVSLNLADHVPPLLVRLGLSEHLAKPVAALSGGLKQRLALALALLADPPILLLDEPTANLDADAQRDYLKLLMDLRKNEGKTIVFASHRLEEVEALASRVFVLEQGRLVATLTPAQLLERLMPEIELALWVPEPQKNAALECLVTAGWSAHFNGRGTVVVRVRGEEKMKAFEALTRRGIRVNNFEVERK